VEFTAVRKPRRLTLDPRLRTHDYDMLNNREPRFGTGRRAVKHRLDDPTRETARRDRLVSAWMPVAWWNDFGGVTLGVRQRSNYLGRYEHDLVSGSVGSHDGRGGPGGATGPRRRSGRGGAMEPRPRRRRGQSLRCGRVRAVHGGSERASALLARDDARPALVWRGLCRRVRSRAPAPHPRG